MSPARWHRDLPWREFMRVYRWVRSLFFTAPRPEGRHLFIPPGEAGASPAEFLTLKIGRRGYGPGHRFSYDKGEDLNLRNIYYDTDRADGVEWWQDHVRAWVDDSGGVWLSAHVEPTPEDHPKPHLDGVGASRDDGLDQLATTLDAAGIPYEERDWPPEQ